MDSYAHTGKSGYDATTIDKLSHKTHSTYDPENPSFRRNISSMNIAMLPTVESLANALVAPQKDLEQPDNGINGNDSNG